MKEPANTNQSPGLQFDPNAKYNEDEMSLLETFYKQDLLN